MRAAQNDLLPRIGPGTPCGELMREACSPEIDYEQLAAAKQMLLLRNGVRQAPRRVAA